MKQTEKAIAAVDRLLTSAVGQENLLLDLRLNLSHKREPGLCVAAYYQLRRQLSAWYAEELDHLRGGLEYGIALEIFAADERKMRCLGLGEESRLEDYCYEAMKKTVLEFGEFEEIRMSFCWA